MIFPSRSCFGRIAESVPEELPVEQEHADERDGCVLAAVRRSRLQDGECQGRRVVRSVAFFLRYVVPVQQRRHGNVPRGRLHEAREHVGDVGETDQLVVDDDRIHRAIPKRCVRGRLVGEGVYLDRDRRLCVVAEL